jgi:hypothetical protein
LCIAETIAFDTAGARRGTAIVKKTRAIAAALVGLALTASVAFAANPHRETTTAAEVTQDDQDDQAEAPEVEAPDTDTPEADQDTGTAGGSTATSQAQGEHGALVSAVAQDKTAVGGPNNNHGGAVSIVARGTHGANAVKKGKSATHKPG